MLICECLSIKKRTPAARGLLDESKGELSFDQIEPSHRWAPTWFTDILLVLFHKITKK